MLTLQQEQQRQEQQPEQKQLQRRELERLQEPERQRVLQQVFRHMRSKQGPTGQQQEQRVLL